MLDFVRHNKATLLTFAGVLLIGFLAREAIGRIYGAAEAIDLIDALARAGLYLGSAIATASATTIALMLTILGMIRNVDEEFDHTTYGSISNIAKLATFTLVTSLLLLFAFVLPTGEFEEMPERWFSILYDGLFATTVLMVGLSAATVVKIYETIRRVIAKITPGKNI
ncbi:hypothetical protein AAG598_13470 [Citromicrobium bathyomarinum]